MNKDAKQWMQSSPLQCTGYNTHTKSHILHSHILIHRGMDQFPSYWYVFWIWRDKCELCGVGLMIASIYVPKTKPPCWTSTVWRFNLCIMLADLHGNKYLAEIPLLRPATATLDMKFLRCMCANELRTVSVRSLEPQHMKYHHLQGGSHKTLWHCR